MPEADTFDTHFDTQNTTRCQTTLMLREDKLSCYALNFVSACSARIFSHTYVTVRPG